MPILGGHVWGGTDMKPLIVSFHFRRLKVVLLSNTESPLSSTRMKNYWVVLWRRLDVHFQAVFLIRALILEINFWGSAGSTLQASLPLAISKQNWSLSASWPAISQLAQTPELNRDIWFTKNHPTSPTAKHNDGRGPKLAIWKLWIFFQSLNRLIRSLPLWLWQGNNLAWHRVLWACQKWSLSWARSKSWAPKKTPNIY